MTSNDKCYCLNNDLIIFDKKYTSRMVSLITLVCFFSFSTGYFVGKKYSCGIQPELEDQHKYYNENSSLCTADNNSLKQKNIQINKSFRCL